MSKFEILAEHLRSQIQSGQLQLGDRLPSIAQLRKQFAVSYGTVRGAMLILKAERLIVGRQGEGVFVASGDGRATVGFADLAEPL